MGHLTVREYMGFFDISEWQSYAKCGFEPHWITDRKIGWADVEHHISYLREMRCGETVAVRATITGVGTKSLKIRHEMHNETTGALSAVLDSVSVQFDLTARSAIPLLQEVRDQATSLIVDLAR